MQRRTSTVIVIAALFVAALPTSAASIAAPVLLGPNDGSTLEYPDEAPLFRWKKNLGAESYRLEIDDEPGFIDPTTVTTRNAAYAPTTPQTIGQTFYWRVQATAPNDSVSGWSPTWSYQIAWPDGRPDLQDPADGDTIEDVILEWSAVPGAGSYQIQVSPNGDWTDTVLNVGSKGTTYAPTQTLDNASYFWRVRALDPGSPANAGPWSEEWQFTRTWADTPELLEPADTIAVSIDTPTFRWTPIPRADHYEVWIGTDVNFSDGTFDTCETNHTTLTYYVREAGSGEPGSCSGSELESQPGVVYHWRVRGIDAPTDVESPWSETREFIARATEDDIPGRLTPAEGATVDRPTLRWESVPNIERYEVTIEGPDDASVTTYGTSWTPTSLFSDGAYTWHVETLDHHGEPGVIGDEGTFTLTAPAGDTTPALLTPTNGAHTVRMPSMTWDGVVSPDVYYQVWYSIQGSGVDFKLSGNTKVRNTGFTYTGVPLAPDTYEWYVEAVDDDTDDVLGTSPTRTFTVDPLDEAAYVGPCSVALTACTVDDMPTLEWETVDDAGSYLVYIAQDDGFTNVVRRYRTQYTTLTPRESLLDNQAGKSYYWFVRPCIGSRCGRYDSTVWDGAFAFHKESNPVALTSPANGASVANLITFSWVDYLTTNLADPDDPTQEARQYRIQVSTVADFASILDDETVDQTSYTPSATTYPEGTLYWRVQAVDGSGNLLTRSSVRSVIKDSPRPTLLLPAAGDTLVARQPYFRWNPQPFAARYDLEVYENGDLNFSPANRVISAQTRLTSWASTGSLEIGTYAWRVRRLDADGRAGPWSLGRRFTLVRGNTTTTVKVSKTPSALAVTGTLTPAHPGAVMQVTLYRKQGGTFQVVATKGPKVNAGGSFGTTFGRPNSGTCKVSARFPGDDDHKPSSASITFNC